MLLALQLVTAGVAAAEAPQPLEPSDGAVLRLGSPITFRVSDEPGSSITIFVSESPATGPNGTFVGTTNAAQASETSPGVFEATVDYPYPFVRKSGTWYWQAQRYETHDGQGSYVPSAVHSFQTRAMRPFGLPLKRRGTSRGLSERTARSVGAERCAAPDRVLHVAHPGSRRELR